MNNSTFNRMTATPDAKRLYQQERTIVDFSEMLCQIMCKQNVTRSDLATRLHVSASAVTQILAGNRNLTLRLMSDVLFALGHRLQPMACTVDAPFIACSLLTETPITTTIALPASFAESQPKIRMEPLSGEFKLKLAA